ncbi:MAG: hypothetical protein EOP04_01500 [Proteobacteria bacterium]|nr:MAG: hypothetical protein EOP04_01500 [Pseudomonadota bacterium]
MQSTKAFFELCSHIGSHTPNWVQGAGGNVSQKYEKNGVRVLRIKASGYRLDKVTPNEGFVDLEYKSTSEAIAGLEKRSDRDTAYAKLLSDGLLFRAKEGNRASMETCFHLCIDAPLVAHFHSLAAVLLADGYFSKDPKVMRFLKYEKDLKITFIDFYKPGLDLAYELAAAPQSQVYILKNHGVILALQNAKQISIWKKWEAKIAEEFGWQRPLQSDAGDNVLYHPLKVYFPDTAVYLKDLMNNLENKTGQQKVYRLKNGSSTDANTKELWEATLRLHRAKPSLVEVPEPLWAEIAGMPAEQFRKTLNAQNEGKI